MEFSSLVYSVITFIVLSALMGWTFLAFAVLEYWRNRDRHMGQFKSE